MKNTSPLLFFLTLSPYYFHFPIPSPTHPLPTLLFPLYSPNSDQSFLSLPFPFHPHPPPMSDSPTQLIVLQACYGDLSSMPLRKHTHITHTRSHLVREPQSPPLLRDGLGLALTVTVCDCNLRLTCWGYMASPGYLHNAQGERWRKPSENKRGG